MNPSHALSALGALALVLPAAALQQLPAPPPPGPLTVEEILPSDTDPTKVTPPKDCSGTVLSEVEHYSVWDPAAYTPSPRLLVYLPGTHHAPDSATKFLQRAARSGYRALGLAYWNAISIEAPCMSVSGGCTEDSRNEVLFGTGTLQPCGGATTAVDISPDNGVVNRLVKALTHLRDNYDAGWGEFVLVDPVLMEEVVRWERVTLAGHSQGAGHVALLAKKHHHVQRVMMFAGPGDHFVDASGTHVADWLTHPEQETPVEDFYGLVHEQDATKDLVFAAWGPAGLGIPGGIPEIEVEPFLVPASGQVFVSKATSADLAGAAPHGAPIKDWTHDPHYYADAWAYLGLSRAILQERVQPGSCTSAESLTFARVPTLGATASAMMSNGFPGEVCGLKAAVPAPPVILAPPQLCELHVSSGIDVIPPFFVGPSSSPPFDVQIDIPFLPATTAPGAVVTLQAALFDPVTGALRLSQGWDLWLGYN